jgi:hypothetical protein
MAPQNFNPRSLTFNHVLFDVSHVANTTTIHDSLATSETICLSTSRCNPEREAPARDYT